MSPSDQRPKRVQYNLRIYHSVGIQFSNIFDCGNALLIVLKVVVLLKSQYGFDKIVKRTCMPTNTFSKTPSTTETQKSE